MIPQPLSQSSRIEAIDVIRGFTLSGIMLVHMVEQYYAGPHPEKINAAGASVIDQIAVAFTSIFIMGKFYMIFSFLFGLSFFIQSSKRDSGFLLRFSWRLLILFAIGFIHHLHYRGDILTIYAILGMGLLLLSWLPDKALLIVALILVLDLPAFATRLVSAIAAGDGPVPSAFNIPDSERLAYFDTVKSGSYLDILEANLADFSTKMTFQVESGRIYITLGLFLLGVYAGRKQWFHNLGEKRPYFRRANRFALWSLMAAIVTALIVFGGANVMGIHVAESTQMLIGMLVYDLFNFALALFYVTAIVLLFLNERWKKRLMIFYPVGRMGLTTYLLQSLMGTLIFFSYGLGLLFDFGAAACFGLALVLFIVQIVFARTWFNYFQYGPVEWLWRSLTYFKIQSMKKKEATTSVTA